MRRQLLLLSLVALPAFLWAGCATGPTYRATARSPDDGAVVRSAESCVWIESVDGRSRSSWDSSDGPILVDPGMRTLTVTGHHSRDVGRVEIKVTLQAGHAYRIQILRNDKFMTFWVEDVKTHEAVSDKQSIEATTVPLKPLKLDMVPFVAPRFF